MDMQERRRREAVAALGQFRNGLLGQDRTHAECHALGFNANLHQSQEHDGRAYFWAYEYATGDVIKLHV